LRFPEGAEQFFSVVEMSLSQFGNTDPDCYRRSRNAATSPTLATSSRKALAADTTPQLQALLP
jgi:hypothetical protein